MPPFSRRLVSQFLMFGLISIVATGIGVLLAYDQLSDERHDREHLDLLDTTAKSLVREFRDRRGQHIQHLLDRAAISGGLLGVLDCAVLRDGRIAFHSVHEKNGRPSPLTDIPDGPTERKLYAPDGSVQQVLYLAPLRSGKQSFGVLAFGVAPRVNHDWLWRLLEAAPPVILVPMLVVFVGSWCVGKSSRTHTVIEQRLNDLASGVPVTPAILEHLEDATPVAQGWNRLVDHLQTSPGAASASGGVLAGLSSFRDKQAERVLQALPEGIAVTDAEGRVRLANPAMAGILNVGPDTVRNSALADLLPRESPDLARVRELLASESNRPCVVELLRGADLADGCLRIARYPLNPDNPKRAEHAWLIRDVTQQKLAERAREEFVASATHELRTPLTNIKAYAETLSLCDDFDPVEQKHFLNTINQEATRLSRFVDELLNISKMEAGSIALTRQLTDVARLLSEATDAVRPQIQQKHIHFEEILPAKLPELNLDKDKFMAALVNLLGNAAKYTPEGGTVCLKVESQPNSLVIHVQDTGFGISPEEVAKLGSRFFRSSDPRVQEVTGSGLGLAFTQDVIRLHGGRMTIQSELNKGSTFTVNLPLSA